LVESDYTDLDIITIVSLSCFDPVCVILP